LFFFLLLLLFCLQAFVCETKTGLFFKVHFEQ
jgi:hypothetical protein